MQRKYSVGLKIVLFLSVLGLPACGFIKPENLNLITAKELHALMNKDDILLVDVHVPEQKHIIGTDFHAAFYKVDDFADQFPKEKHAPIYLYCESGPMGNWAARTLFDMGHTNIYNLKGGIDAWKAAGLPVVN